MNKQNRINLIIVAFILIIIISACATSQDIKPCLEGKTYGFLWGLWHGIIAPIEFIGMVFGKNVTVYAQNTNGAWYAFGFLLGSGGWGFMGGRRLGRKKRVRGN